MGCLSRPDRPPEMSADIQNSFKVRPHQGRRMTVVEDTEVACSGDIIMYMETLSYHGQTWQGVAVLLLRRTDGHDCGIEARK